MAKEENGKYFQLKQRVSISGSGSKLVWSVEICVSTVAGRKDIINYSKEETIAAYGERILHALWLVLFMLLLGKQIEMKISAAIKLVNAEGSLWQTMILDYSLTF